MLSVNTCMLVTGMVGEKPRNSCRGLFKRLQILLLQLNTVINKPECK